ncbi:hypothetical protein VTJ83DRAFT_2076 [Remersonia thermophila]|uniref:Nucleotidyltransferase n=1 Tax=Remersonia thermophila TaxID=72144 RepID=A0ABR4DHZ9_9PEZI
MGGSAFSSLPNAPYTPRMPPEVYRQVVSACGAALRDLFVCVATPIEAPAKRDYGDIDMLVALERRVLFPRAHEDATPRQPRELMSSIQSVLGAEYALIGPSGCSANLAIPWPSDLDKQAEDIGTGSGGGGVEDSHRGGEKKYIQVDIRVCPDVNNLCWILYRHAHGDLWNIIGSTIRPYGLTVDEEALWLRIPEVEKFDRKKAKVLLSQDPAEILHFLGMKVHGYWDAPFESVDALFEYATSCRLFCVKETPGDDGDDVGMIGGEEGRKKLKSNDRRRMAQRSIFRSWVNEYIPNLRAQNRFIRKGKATSLQEARAAVRDEAFARFFVGPEYRARLREFQLERDSAQMKSLIKELIPTDMDPQRRACLVSGMLKILMGDDRSFGFIPSGLKNQEGFYDKEVVRKFIQDNMAEVAKVAWDKQLERARASMQRKALARAAGERG